MKRSLNTLKNRDDRFVRLLSGARETRCPLGPVSCRQVQLLRMLTPLAKSRKELSELWRGALSHKILGPPLVHFFHHNMTDALENITITTSSMNDVLSLRQKILPFVLSRREHVLHYFLILVKNNKYFIYSAYGSDYVRIHPRKIPLDMDEFRHFIEMVNKEEYDIEDKKVKDVFIRKYFLEGGSQQNYIDEGKSRRVHPNIEKGKLLELAQYNEPFKILYYPTLLEHLYDAAKPALDSIERKKNSIKNSKKNSKKNSIKTLKKTSKRY